MTKDFEAEIIGSLLNYPEQLAENEINVEHFNDPRHIRLIKAILEMQRDGEPLSKILLGRRLPDLEYYIWELAHEIPGPQVPYSLAQLRQEYVQRRLQEASADYLQNPNAETQAKMIASIKKFTQDQAAKEPSTKEALEEVIESLQHDPDYLPTSFKTLNNIIGGLRPGGMYVIAARPGIGKTMFALQLAYEMAAKQGILYFSLEMSRSELMKRIVCMTTGLSTEDVLSRKIRPEHLAVIKKQKFNENILIDDKPGVTVDRIRAVFSRANVVSPVKAIFIDYLGLMEDVNKSASRYEKVTNISNDIKRLARELDVPIVALHQLNREVESRTNGMPQLADLRDSGAIEQDADVVMLLHRNTKKELGDVTKIELEDKLHVLIAKNRHGRMGIVRFEVQPSSVRVREFHA